MPRHDDDTNDAGDVKRGPDPQETIVPLHVEETVVSRRQRETGIVRISTQTRMVEKLVEEPLVQQRAEIKHVPIGRTVDRAPEIRQEGDYTIIPVVEEIVVVERRLFLKEEVHVRRVQTTRSHTQTLSLRQQEVVVTRTPPGDVDASSAAGNQADINPRTKDTSL